MTSDGFFTAAEEANLQINGNGKQKKAVPVKKKEPKVGCHASERQTQLAIDHICSLPGPIGWKGYNLDCS